MSASECTGVCELDTLIGGNWAVCSYTEYKKHDLPVTARNCLENGKSANLWYEEVVPHKSVFYTVVITPNTENFDALEGQLVQIGGGASIGYGLTRFTKVVPL